MKTKWSKDGPLKIIPWSGYGGFKYSQRTNYETPTRCNSTLYRPKILEMVI